MLEIPVKVTNYRFVAGLALPMLWWPRSLFWSSLWWPILLFFIVFSGSKLTHHCWPGCIPGLVGDHSPLLPVNSTHHLVGCQSATIFGDTQIFHVRNAPILGSAKLEGFWMWLRSDLLKVPASGWNRFTIWSSGFVQKLGDQNTAWLNYNNYTTGYFISVRKHMVTSSDFILHFWTLPSFWYAPDKHGSSWLHSSRVHTGHNGTAGYMTWVRYSSPCTPDIWKSRDSKDAQIFIEREPSWE